MRAHIYLGLVLLTVLPACAQDEPEATASADAATSTGMLTPPPVSGQVYPTLVGEETRSNYLRTGLIYSTGYVHNLYPGVGAAPVNDTTYLVQPTIAFDRTTSRVRETVTYNPAFAFYQPTSVLNTINQSATGDILLHLSPHVMLRADDSFQKTSTSFGLNSSGSQGISGSTQSVTPGVVAPFAPQITNRVGSEASWQFSGADMIAASGMLANLDFTNSSEANGFYNSETRGGSASYSHRLTAAQYIGAMYQYSRIQASPLSSVGETAESETQTHNAFGFYTVYFQPKLSLSLVGGPQYYDLAEQSTQPVRAWNAAGMASLGWQGFHTSLAANFSHIVTAGNGVIGAYETDAIGASGRWQMSRSWAANLGGNYSRIGNVSSQSIAGSIGSGDTASGTISIEHTIVNNLDMTCSYSHLHQVYSNITTLSVNPDSDSVVVSLLYRFSRPVGR